MRTDEDRIKGIAEFCRDWEYLNVASELIKTYITERVVLSNEFGNLFVLPFLLLINVLLLVMFCEI